MTVYDQELSKLYIVHAPDGSTVVFDPENERYKCCCRTFHVRTASVLIGILQIIATLIGLVVIIINYYRLGQNYSIQFTVGIIFVVLYVIVLSLFFCSICAQNATFVVGFLLLQFVTMILFLTVISIVAIQWANDDYVGIRYWAGRGPELDIDVSWSYLTVAIALIAVCSISLFFYIWFCTIVWRCYRYFAERKKFRNYIAASQVVRVPFENSPQVLDVTVSKI